MIATDPLSLVFIGCFVVSGTFLLISSLLGAGAEDLHLGHFGHPGHSGGAGHAAGSGHASGIMHHTLSQGHDAGHAAHSGTTAGHGAQASHPTWAILASFFNLYALLTFLFWFGLIGYVLKNLANFGALLASTAGLAVGIVGAVLITIVMRRFMGRDYGELTAESSELVGTLATVSMPIRAGGIGEIIYKKGTGARKSIGARSVDDQPIARDAEVVIVGYEKGIAQVQTWDRFITETDELEDVLRMQRGSDSAQTLDVTSAPNSEQV